ncbi:M6 family metalloprotease domain-containing protein, partial [Bacteroidales bacterium OttesenSCG-928-K22]|nr:M6 family metalloprotease domain-containing protein [Bacteroidales bacterium OttesenSCG-928-K22]
AVTAYPDPIEYRLPDGNSITIMLKGDECVHWAMTEDGYTLMLNHEGYYEYAIIDEFGDLTCSGIRAKNEIERTADDIAFLSNIQKNLHYSNEQIAMLLQITNMKNSFADKLAERELRGSKDFVGEVHAPLILVEFPSTPFTKTKEDFELLMNQPNYTAGGLTGSVYDFFYASSYGQLEFSVDIFGPYEMEHEVGYYDNNSGGNSQYMAIEAATAAHNEGCNFADYDLDNDGYVDGIHIIFAGYGQEAGAPAGQSIWSHAWSIWMQDLYLDGKRVYRFSCSPELRGNSGSDMTHIGVISHELSHVFGLPDLYDTDYSGTGGNSVDIGPWDIMAGGSWNDSGRTPALHSAWCKDFLGWVKATVISSEESITLPNPADEGASYRIDTSTPNEYFLVENRQKINWDSFIPKSGMLIYHVNENNSGWNSNCINCNPNNRGLYVKQANGGMNSNSTTHANAPYPTETNTSFTDNSIPNSKSWAGGNTNRPITNITHDTEERTISFDFMSGVMAYTIYVNASPTSGGTATGGGTYLHEETATLVAEPKNNYEFVNWTEDGNVVSTDAEYIFEVTESRILVANFTLKPYTINVNVSQPERGSAVGAGTYVYGTSVRLEATANDGFVFGNWTEDDNIISKQPIYRFQAVKDRDIVANFFNTNANLIDIVTDNGKLSPDFSSDVTDYILNVDVSVETISITGILQDENAIVEGNVNNASINSGSNDFSLTVTAEDGKTKKTYNIAINKTISYNIVSSISGKGGTILPFGNVTVFEGTSQTFVITPDELYDIKQVLINGVNNEQAVNDGYYTFENINSNSTIEVSFQYFSIDEISNELKVYPNPVENYLIIESEEFINNIVIYNTEGKKVFENKNIKMNSVHIDVKEFSTGIYYINVDGKIEKIIKK